METYTRDRTVEDLLSVQRDIALRVASELGVEVLPERHGDFLDVDAPDDLAAYERYLVGLSHFRDIARSTGDQQEAYERASENLSAAIEAAPDWAPPRAVLGAVYHWMASRGVGVPENWARSKALLEEALAIDSL